MPADTLPCPPAATTPPYPDLALALRYCGCHLKLTVAAINSSIPNDHVWHDLALEVALINRIFFTGNVNKQFMQLPLVAGRVCDAMIGDALQDQSLPEILTAIPLADDDSDISFKIHELQDVWWTTDSPPLCANYAKQPLDDVVQTAHLLRCKYDPTKRSDPLTALQMLDIQRKLLADMLQKKKEELQLVEYELATIGDRMTTMEDTFWSDLL
ncbi:hypothetical protein BU15DRAFT_79849 [Melanogaster broomeanus]|nr:hypothetical protein BU15DRAFT_79849 [Melanogaster broomeanus]